MVRETRHLWVGNLPENIREDRIREHFKRYGRVQSVKLLPRNTEEKTGEVQMACTVAFMDIKSASKAHNAELKIDDRTLNTEYYEPAAIPSAASPLQGTPPPYSTSTSPGATRFPNGHGSSDEHGFSDPTGGAVPRFYDRPAAGGVAAAPISAPEGGSGTCRGGRNRDRFRGGGGHRGAANVWGTAAAGYADTSRYNNSNERSQSDTTGYSSAPSSDTNDRRNSDIVRKKAKSRSGSRSPSPNGSTSTRSPSRSRSRSSSSSSSSSTSRDTSSTSSPRSRRHRRHYKKTAAQIQAAADDRRPLGICVRNLPVRSSDTSLKDGLFHEYKKHGKVTWVKVVGQNADRHAIVCFKKPEDAEKALEVSYDKLFFGCKIEVAAHTVCDIDEVECRYESEIDEYNPKATRTLFIGNLEKDVTASDLRKHFDQFGEIIEIDIKKQGAVSSYAFCQYSDIVSVVKAIRKMDGEHLGNNRIKLGFGKSMAYNCVWIDGVPDTVTEKYLRIQFEPFGAITKCIIDREKGQSLVFYEHVSQAQLAVNKMRGFVLKNAKLQVDFASRECQECFFERLEKQGTVLDRAGFEDRRDSSSRSFESTAPSRISRYDTPTRPRTSSYSSRSSVAAVASPGTPGNATPRGGRARVRYYEYDLEYSAAAALEGAARHAASHRSYDEYSQGSAASHEDPYDPYDHPVTYLHDSPGHLDPLEVRVVQNIVEAVPYAPHDIRNLQKERVHLLEQLEECPSSGDELISPKKRLKLDLLDPTVGDVIIEANRDHNRKVMEVRRLSESTLRHHSRRPSVDNKYGHYAPHTVGCKRRRTGGSDGGARSGAHSHYAEHSDGSEQAGSRPGTPLCDENPEFPPGEPPKRTTRERGEGPLMLPLPKWAAQVRCTPEFQRGAISVAGIKGQKEHVNPLASPPPAATSPRVSHHHAPRPPSPSHHVPPPASPPPRPPSLSSNSSDSDGATGSPSLEERIKSLDEKYEKWSGSRALSAAGNDALAMLDANREKFRLRHKLLEIQDLKEVQPSEIVKSVMAKRSVFDEDLKRLECVGEKYEPKEFGLFCRLPAISAQSSGSSTPVSSVSSAAPLTVMAPTLKLTTSVSTQLPKTPTMLSPRSSGTALPIPASRGLQYPFPSHPPMQMSPAPTLTPTPPATVTSTALPTPPATSTSTSVAVRNPSLGENRLKPSVNVPGDARTSSVKNRSVVPVVSDVSSAGKPKPSEKVTLRRNSSSTSPRADVKTRRNSDTSARRIDDKSEEQKLADKAKEELEKQRKEQEEKERVEKERIEKEKQEKERLERERKEKERLERESELEKQRLEKERLEKERIQREKEKAEREKEIERERLRQEKEKAAKLERERLEKERQEKERQEKEKQQRLQQEKEEREKKEREERELKERLEKEAKERKEKEEWEREQKAKEEAEQQRLAKEKERRKSEDRGSSRNKDSSDNHHERSSKHRENHSDPKHRENNTHHHADKHEKQSSTKEPDSVKKDNSDRRDVYQETNKHENLKAQIERDAERRKESIKENRDNNIHDKHKHLIEVKDRAIVETRHMSLDLDNKIPVLDANKRKERNNSLPANVGLKRRMSSHESLETIEEAKKIKLHDQKKVSERRDSKDSSKSDEKSKNKSKHKNNSHEKHNNTKDSEERRKEKEREREERHKHKHRLEKQKSKSKSKEIRDSPVELSSSEAFMNDKDFLAKLNLRSNEEIERERQKKEASKEKRVVIELEKRPEEKKPEDRSKKDKQQHSFEVKEPLKSPSLEDKQKLMQQDQQQQQQQQEKHQKKDRIRKVTNTSDSDSDEPKKHSIFDIVDDGPPYISMYDKVKARSCKNMQKLEEEKRQEKIKAKFSQLKLSRARREEKKRSTSWDEDSDSDKESEIKSRRNRKVLDSSDDSQERKSHHKLDSDSDNSLHLRSIKTEPAETTDEDVKMKHQIFKTSKSRITSDTSEDEYHKSQINNKIGSIDYHEKKMKDFRTSFFENDNEAELDIKTEKLTSVKSEIERLVKKERRNSKFQEAAPTEHQTFDVLHAEPSEVKIDKFNVFDNTTDEEFAEIKKEKSEKRERKHKKKQKKQKHSASSEESFKIETESVLGDASEKKHHEKKKDHSKKDKKRDKTKEGREKSKKSKKNKSEEKGETKREGKMETIFGSSEDSEAGNKEQKPQFIVDENAQVPPVYNTDSEKEPEVKSHEERDRESEHKRKKEKKRREKERRLQEAAAEAAAAAADEPPNSNDNSMDFADMCKQLEANIKDDTSEVEYKTEIESTTVETSDTFTFNDQEIKKEKEERKEGKEKKKKRKKSKDEKKHHHHHHHHDKNKIKTPEVKEEPTEPALTVAIPEIKVETIKEAQSPTVTTPLTPSSQSLPSLAEIPSPTMEKPSPDFVISPSTRDMVPLISPIPKTPTTSKTKLIPSFGTELDEVVHENAVKSISRDILEPLAETEEAAIKEEPKEDSAQELSQDKPRVVISQEETEDAVAALLGESFGSNQFEERYSEEVNTSNEEVIPELVEEENVQDDEEMRKAVQSLEVDGEISKPDTPQSEHELQIDTDTEEQEESSQAADQIPKTPEAPSFAQVPKTPDVQFFSSEKMPATPSPLTYKSLNSPPSLTPIKPLPSAAAVAEVKKNLESKVVSEQPQRTVIAQTWPTERKEVVVAKAEVPPKEIKPQQPPPVILPVVSAAPLIKPFAVPSPASSEPNYPPLAKLSLDQKAVVTAPAPSTPVVVQQSRHNLPACSPVQVCKPANQENIMSPKTSSNVPLNRLPITPVMATKPLQPTTVYLPQSIVAHSSEPPKLVSTAELRQERPRMMFQSSNVQSYPPAFSPGQASPRMVLQGNIRHLPPGGLHINPTSYGSFMGNVSHSSSYVPLPPKEVVQNQPQAVVVSSMSEPVKPLVAVLPRTTAPVINIPQLVLSSSKPIPTSGALSPLTPLKSPTSSQTFVAPPQSPRQSPKPIPVIVESTVAVPPPPDKQSPITPPKAATPEPAASVKPLPVKEPSVHLSIPPLESRTSTPSPVIVANPEVKAENNLPPSPLKLAIETVTEELNLSLEKKEEVKEDVKEPEAVKTEIKEDVAITLEAPTAVAPLQEEQEKKLEPLPVETPKEDDKTEKPLPPDIVAPSISMEMLSKDDDPLENKDDNEFWSAKDSVNIDSVIKTLGSADEMSDTENKEPSTPKPPKDESPPKTPEKKVGEPESKIEAEEPEPNEDSMETEDDQKPEISQTRSSARRGRGGRPRGVTNSKVVKPNVERVGIQTRRGKLKEAQAQPVTPTKRGRGGKVRSERKSSKSESDSAANDVYEFREDSDDSNKEQRPRLVLTIKSTTSSTSNTQATAIIKEITKDGAKEIGKETVVQPKPKEIVKELPAAPPPLPSQAPPAAETKEEFTSPQTANTRKSRRLAEKDISRNTVDDTIEDVVKNTPLTRSASNQRRSGRQQKKPQPIAPETSTTSDTPRKSPRGRKPSRRASEAAENSSSEDMKEDNLKPIEVPVALITPVVPSSPNKTKPELAEKPKEQQAPPPSQPSEKKVDHCSLKTAMLKRFKVEMNANKKPEPTNLIDPVTGMLILMRESEEGKYIPLPGTSPGDKKPAVVPKEALAQIKPVDSTKTQPSVIAQSHQVTVVQQSVPKVHSLKAHVLSSQAAKAVVSEIPPKPPVVHSPATQARETVPQVASPSPSVVVSKPTTPALISRSGTPVTSSANLQSVRPTSPRPGVPVAEVKPQQLLLANQKHILHARELGQIQAHMSSSITPKQAQIVNTQMAHMKQQHQVIMGAKGGMPKAPHALHQQHLPGQIASPPISKAQASGRIIQGPPQGGAKGVMEPPKIDVNIPNPLMGRPNLSPSGPQARLAGLPVPAYEASLMAEARAYYNRTSPPPAHQNSPHSPKGEPMAHYPPGPLRPPELNPAHYMHPQHMMYQHLLRQQQHFQRSANLEKSGEEGEEAPVGLALSGRGAAVPHHSPHDRATESPAIGQVYNSLSARLPPYHPGTRYFDQQPAEPPPAHRPLTSHDRAGLPHLPLGTPDRPLGAHSAAQSSAHLIPDRPTGVIPERPMSAHLAHDRGPSERPQISYGPERALVGAHLGAAGNFMGAVAKHIGADAPASQRGILVATPPLASQVPPQAESLFMLLKHYPLMWQGLLALKNDQAAVQMYCVSGNDDVAKISLPKNIDGSTPPLRIFQRMRLEPMQVEGVARKMQMEKEHCMLLALPCGHDHMDVLKQSTNLTYGFITYLQQKQAAGIINVAAPGTTHPPAYVIHIFPSCDFVNENLRRIAPSLLERVADIAHLLIVITTV